MSLLQSIGLKRAMQVMLFSASLVAAVDARELVVGYFLTSPHVIGTQDEARPAGLAVDIWERVAAHNGDTILWKKMPLARVMRQLKSGLLDGSSAFVPTPVRAQSYIFPESVIDTVQPVIVVRTEHPLSVLKGKDDLKDMDIGYFLSGVVTPWFEAKDIKFKLLGGGDALERLLTQLNLGRLDAIYWPTTSAVKYDAHRLGYSRNLKYLRAPEGPYPLKAMFPKNAKGQALADQFDSAFKVVMAKYDLEKQKRFYITGAQ